jgi:hypothetical protein
MSELPPDLRDRAARAATNAMLVVSRTGMRSDQEIAEAVVDAVAEVLAAEQCSPNDYSGGPARSEREIQLERDLAVEQAHQAQAAKDYNNALGPMIRERDALKARVAELERPLREMVRLLPDTPDLKARAWDHIRQTARAVLSAKEEKRDA